MLFLPRFFCFSQISWGICIGLVLFLFQVWSIANALESFCLFHLSFMCNVINDLREYFELWLKKLKSQSLWIHRRRMIEQNYTISVFHEIKILGTSKNHYRSETDTKQFFLNYKFNCFQYFKDCYVPSYRKVLCLTDICPKNSSLVMAYVPILAVIWSIEVDIVKHISSSMWWKTWIIFCDTLQSTRIAFVTHRECFYALPGQASRYQYARAKLALW